LSRKKMKPRQKVKCVICGSYYIRRGQRAGTCGAGPVRPVNSITCSRVCAREYVKRRWKTDRWKKSN